VAEVADHPTSLVVPLFTIDLEQLHNDKWNTALQGAPFRVLGEVIHGLSFAAA
jgi:hypothetical protein